jgi:hypothetical protein
MGKKHSEGKKPDMTLSPKAILMNTHFSVGNFWQVRRYAHDIVLSENASEKELNAARAALKITWPDPLALLAGLFCLAFSVIVAFVAAY